MPAATRATKRAQLAATRRRRPAAIMSRAEISSSACSRARRRSARSSTRRHRREGRRRRRPSSAKRRRRSRRPPKADEAKRKPSGRPPIARASRAPMLVGVAAGAPICRRRSPRSRRRDRGVADEARRDIADDRRTAPSGPIGKVAHDRARRGRARRRHRRSRRRRGWQPLRAGRDDPAPAPSCAPTSARAPRSSSPTARALVLDHATELAFDAAEPRHMTLTARPHRRRRRARRQPPRVRSRRRTAASMSSARGSR